MNWYQGMHSFITTNLLITKLPYYGAATELLSFWYWIFVTQSKTKRYETTNHAPLHLPQRHPAHHWQKWALQPGSHPQDQRPPPKTRSPIRHRTGILPVHGPAVRSGAGVYFGLGVFWWVFGWLRFWVIKYYATWIFSTTDNKVFLQRCDFGSAQSPGLQSTSELFASMKIEIISHRFHRFAPI